MEYITAMGGGGGGAAFNIIGYEQKSMKHVTKNILYRKMVKYRIVKSKETGDV